MCFLRCRNYRFFGRQYSEPRFAPRQIVQYRKELEAGAPQPEGGFSGWALSLPGLKIRVVKLYQAWDGNLLACSSSNAPNSLWRTAITLVAPLPDLPGYRLAGVTGESSSSPDARFVESTARTIAPVCDLVARHSSAGIRRMRGSDPGGLFVGIFQKSSEAGFGKRGPLATWR